jgi:tetratricopeptide (TPR) repeat protein
MSLSGLFYPWGFILQAVAILHFIRRRPETYWLWIILIGGGLGALVYIAAEVAPDASLLRGAFDAMGRRRRIRDLEATVLDNPSVGNLEELADQYLDDGRFARARELYEQVIASGRADSLHPYYRRGLAEVALEDFTDALVDLEPVVSRDPKYDFQALSACWRTPTPVRAIRTKPTRCSETRRRSRRCPRRTTTTRHSWLDGSGRLRPENGPGASWPRSRLCLAICAGANGGGFERPGRSSSNSPPEFNDRHARFSSERRNQLVPQWFVPGHQQQQEHTGTLSTALK